MGKVLHTLAKSVVYDILNFLPLLGESVSKVSYFIPEPTNSAEVTRLSEYIRKYWLKSTMKDIKNLINNHTFLVQDPKKVETVTQ